MRVKTTIFFYGFIITYDNKLTRGVIPVKTSKSKLMLHPVRMKIVQSLLGNKQLTVQQIQSYAPDVPQATLYRQLNKLVEGNILIVVEENQIRGTVEKVYALNSEQLVLTKEDLKDLTKEDHYELFLTFLMQLLDDFEDYLKQDEIDMERDMTGYRKLHFYATPEELKDVIVSISESLLPLIKNEKTEDRKAYHLSTVLVPDKNINRS